MRWPGSQVGRMAGSEMRVPASLMRTVLSTQASLVKSSAARIAPASGTRTAKLSPGAAWPSPLPSPSGRGEGGGGGVDGDVDGEAEIAIGGHNARSGDGWALDGEGHGERYGFAGRETIQSGGGGLELDAGGGALPCEQRGG